MSGPGPPMPRPPASTAFFPARSRSPSISTIWSPWSAGRLNSESRWFRGEPVARWVAATSATVSSSTSRAWQVPRSRCNRNIGARGCGPGRRSAISRRQRRLMACGYPRIPRAGAGRPREAWSPPMPRERAPCATAACGRGSKRSRWSPPTARSRGWSEVLAQVPTGPRTGWPRPSSASNVTPPRLSRPRMQSWRPGSRMSGRTRRATRSMPFSSPATPSI